MNIVVDTNIIIRVLIAPNGFVADLYYPSKKQHNLFLSYSTIEEINKHKPRLIKTSGLTRREFDILLMSIIADVTVVPLEQIPNSIFLRSFMFIQGIDYDDVAFVATTLFVKASLWTSDKNLFYGLKKKDFQMVLNNMAIKKILSLKN
ncbi:MAG: PIN domain-containing protein [Bacteroidota bacterium]|nr:PIN domain-containing protein [Bacteroidota bacterium]